MTAEQMLLLLLGSGEAEGDLDPVRLQKTAFVMGERMRARGEEPPFEFKPYDYGPFSIDVCRTIDSLVARGLVETIDVPGRDWKQYRLTNSGRQVIVAAEIATRWRMLAGRLHDWSIARPFRTLLQAVYKEFPEFAAKTKLPELTE